MKTSSAVRILVIFLFLAPATFAAPRPPADSASTTITPQQALNLRRIADLRFSPDGTRLAFTVSEPPKDTANPTHIWVMDVATKQVRQYTYSDKSENSPRWSPDGKFLAFLSSRDEDRQIYLLSSSGGDAYAITTGKRGIASFAWSPDGKQIAFLASDEPSDAEQKKEKDKDDAVVIDKEDKHSRVWILDVATKKARAITGTQWEVREAEWAPNGNRLIVSATDHPESDDNTDRIFSLDLTAARCLCSSRRRGLLAIFASRPTARSSLTWALASTALSLMTFTSTPPMRKLPIPAATSRPRASTAR